MKVRNECLTSHCCDIEIKRHLKENKDFVIRILKISLEKFVPCYALIYGVNQQNNEVIT